MKQPLIYVQDPNALKNWLNACSAKVKVLYDLHNLESRFSANEYILLIQITESSSVDEISKLAQYFDTIATSNEPSDTEGLLLFQRGVKGYINTFSTVERIKQALDTVQNGNVWLGQSVMQFMIKALQPEQIQRDRWKEQLTEREIQTAEKVLESKSNKEIAIELEITERTVKSHLHNIFEKLHVKDRLGLALAIKNWH